MYIHYADLNEQQQKKARRMYGNEGQPGPLEAYEYNFGVDGQLLGRRLIPNLTPETLSKAARPSKKGKSK
jgi:hypothetical protein